MQKIRNDFIFSFPPILDEVINESNINITLLTKIPSNSVQMHLIQAHLLFTTLVITNHPQIKERIAYIRESIKKDQQKLTEGVNDLFKILGVTLDRTTWEKSLKMWITEGIFPVPYYTGPFEIVGTPSENILNKPFILLKERITSKNQLIQFIEDNSKQLIHITRNLPHLFVKRTDIDVTKLAIGLWIFNRQELGHDEILREIEKRLENDIHYFQIYSSLTKTDLAKLKSESINYLKKLLSF